ncbi:alcohol dehydrogenase [Mycobacterium lentiflavum]|uniref:Alcohol dehydrogenase n=1 Tax=Mycobacterium lentiflavum TaxID=141349 RepID=A0A0E4H1L8_MYCLN|nr:NADP-dependent oxidoreductase [Mycobacterium lentiflavum]CQD15024.1 alcohol dehydrogenase [Mycobacterium lentiflavum]
MPTLKRIQYHQYGGPEVMRLEPFEPGELGANDVRVRVRAASANPMDFGIRSGAMKLVTGRSFPRAMGYDFAGIVEAVGDKVSRLRAGDEVLGAASIKRSGAFADVIVAEQNGVVKKPVGLSFEAAATLPIASGTAYQALFNKGRLSPGERVFVHASLGAVGRSAVQLAFAHGASVVAGSCRPGSADEARELRLDPIVDFDFDPTPLARRFDIVLDAAGKLPLKTARKMLTPEGRILTIAPTPANMARSALPGRFNVVIGKAIPADGEAVAQAAVNGHLRIPIAQTVPLSEAIPALTHLERSGLPTRGKLIVVPD